MASSCFFLYLNLLFSSFNFSLKESSYPEGTDKFKACHFFSFEEEKQTKPPPPKKKIQNKHTNSPHLSPKRKKDPGHESLMAFSVLTPLVWNQSNKTKLCFPPQTTPNGVKTKAPDLQTCNPGTYSIGGP